MTYRVEYFRDGKWKETMSPAIPGPYRSEAERLASKRSGNNGLVYRVIKRKGAITYVISEWQHGNQLSLTDNE